MFPLSRVPARARRASVTRSRWVALTIILAMLPTVGHSTEYGLSLEGCGGYQTNILGLDTLQLNGPFISAEVRPGLRRRMTESWDFLSGAELRWTGFRGARGEFSALAEGAAIGKWPGRNLQLRGEGGYFSGPATLDPSRPLDHGLLSVFAEHGWERKNPAALIYVIDIVIASFGRTDVKQGLRFRVNWRPGSAAIPRLRIGIARNASTAAGYRYTELSLLPSAAFTFGVRDFAMAMMYLAYRRYDAATGTGPGKSGGIKIPGGSGMSGAHSLAANLTFLWTRELTNSLDLNVSYDLTSFGSTSAPTKFSHRIGAGIGWRIGSL